MLRYSGKEGTRAPKPRSLILKIRKCHWDAPDMDLLVTLEEFISRERGVCSHGRS